MYLVEERTASLIKCDTNRVAQLWLLRYSYRTTSCKLRCNVTSGKSWSCLKKRTYRYFQRIAATVNTQEQKRLLMDLDISMRSSACPYTVQFYGALFREGDVWICMEVMDMSLDKFYTKVYKSGRAIPEDILGKVAFAVCITPTLK